MPSPTTCTAYRWPDERSGLVAWLIVFPDRQLYGWRRSEEAANQAMSFWCRAFGCSAFVLYQSHPNEVSHAAQ